MVLEPASPWRRQGHAASRPVAMDRPIIEGVCLGHGHAASVRRSAGGAWGASARHRGPAACPVALGVTPPEARW